MKRYSLLVVLALLAVSAASVAAEITNNVTIARLKYPGGGDWYWGSSALPNLIEYIRGNTGIPVNKDEVRIELSDNSLFNYPFLFMTGHGNVNFRADELETLRRYLAAGGFLLANDSYGMRKAFFREMKKLFPDQEPRELPFNHGVFSCYYKFPNGLPKIHRHDDKPPQAFGWFIGERLVVLFVFESDIGDGWEDPRVHNDPPEKRTAALQMGTNILIWALTN
ncbi:MAG: DUF4159 domain-containing protein [candidate division Zixibacteria bacterium]|nr:DUF4159 domain-containing protein [candidate division Zixibacteria bacterium]